MVAAKYLCAAPHPDTWDERANALLKSLGGDQAKRRKMLRQTLATLDVENLVRKVPRPGRKTHSEQAIAFYRHVLALNEGEDSEDDEDTEEQVKPKAVKDEPKTPAAESKKEEKSEKKQEEEEPKKSKPRKLRTRSKNEDASVASMDSEEFREQHNDLCEVCSDGGELVCCSTCNLVFHLHCIRPPTTRFPPDRWCCAYCVAAGVRGHTKEARTRRRAAAAAREMTRMKMELNPELKEDGEAKEPTTKRRGRPPKIIAEPKAADDAKQESVKKRRGRPPKRPVEVEETTEDEAKDDEPVKKRRGRPPKHPVEAEATPESTEDEWNDDDDEEEEEGPVKKRRGRPPKRPVETEMADEAKEDDAKVEEPVKKRRGRPPKRPVEAAATEDDASKDESKQEEPVKKRRGRPPKRPVEAGTKEGEPTAKRAKSEDGDSQPDEMDDGAAEGRTRRERRQPTLYNPQAGAASAWQSDGKREWKTLGEDTSKESGDETDTSAKSVWCTFCGDDPSISVCCFCACRKCFGKHDKSKLLICDRCDAEYHIYCLDPPLKSVPHTKRWFCSTCKTAMKEEKKPPPEPKPEPPKRRGPGRPPKKAPPPIEDIPVLPKRRGRPPKKLTEDLEEEEPVVKKRRGRPPKKKPAPSKKAALAAAKPKTPAQPKTPVTSNVGKKRRGRPPKNRNIQSGKTSAISVPGRDDVSQARSHPASAAGLPLITPRSNPSLKNASIPPNMQAIPGMTSGTAAASATNPQVEAPAPQKSRSGRTFKRNAFHDEIYEGPQLGQYHKPPGTGPASAGVNNSDIGQPAPSYQALLQQKSNAPAKNISLSQVGQPTAKIAPPLMKGMNAPGTGRADMSAPASLAASSGMMRPAATYTPAGMAATQGSLPVPPAVLAYPTSVPFAPPPPAAAVSDSKGPRRKPGARECMQMSRRFGVRVIPPAYMDTLFDYCSRGKVEHLIRMRERLDDHSRMLELQLAGLEALVKEKGELDITVPAGAVEPERSPPK